MYVCTVCVYVAVDIISSIGVQVASLWKSLYIESGHVFEQGGLSDAVSADQAVSPAEHDAQVRSLQQDLPPVGHVEVGHDNILLPIVPG